VVAPANAEDLLRKLPTIVPIGQSFRLEPIPKPLTALIGRDQNVDKALFLLRSSVRLLTLTGAGGIGKTRLAFELAARLHENFSDGVCWVSLAPVADASGVVPAIAKMLGTGAGGRQTPLESLKTALRVAELLLILENFEHVVGAAPEVAALLAGVGAISVLVTSRAPLNQPDEHTFPVPPLA